MVKTIRLFVLQFIFSYDKIFSMYVIEGNTLVFTDQHFGIKNGSKKQLKVMTDVFREILKTIKEKNITNIISCGDLFNNRQTIQVEVMNIVIKLINILAKKCKVYLILGNHDIFYKNSLDVNSVNIFRNNPNIIIVDKNEQANINGANCLFVPWLGDVSAFGKKSFDMIFGHFNITRNYLIQSYIEEHSIKTKTDDDLKNIIDNELKDFGLDSLEYEESNEINDSVGNFVDIVKENGYIYSGHIHKHKEFKSKGRNFIFIGSPCQLSFGEIDCNCGYYVLDENNSRTFIETKSAPKHYYIKMSEVIKTGIDKYDFSFVKNNIIQKVYDVEVDREIETIINQKITDLKPFEESIPKYTVVIENESDLVSPNNFDNIQQSQLEYIKNYIDHIDESILEENNIDKDYLYSLLERYYRLVEKNT